MARMVTESRPVPAAPIRTAVAGFGLSGRVFHLPFLAAHPDFVVSAIVTGDDARRAHASSEYPEALIYSTFDELEEHPGGFDLVVLAGPPDTHLDFAARALRMGAAVVVDKPFVSSVADAETLIAAATRARRPLMVFQNRRWDGDFLTLKALVESGRLGDVFHFESNFEHWAPQAGPGWKDQLGIERGGGVAWDLGSHLVDQALVLFGPATSVDARLRTVRPGGGNDDHAEIHIEHASGTVSRLLMSRVSHAQCPRFRVLGTKGSFVSYGLDPQEPSLADGATPTDPGFGSVPPELYGTLIEDTPAGPISSRPPTEVGAYAEFYRIAAAAIRGEGPEPVPPAEAMAVVEVLARATRDSRS